MALAALRQRLGLDRVPPTVVLPPSLLINGDVEATLQRFLKARGGSVDKAHAMLLNCIQWRAEHDIDSIFERPLPVDKFRHLAHGFPHAHHGFDKRGQPIYIDCTGQLEVESVLEHVTKEEVLHSHIIMMEYQNRVLMAEGSRRMGHTVHRMCNIVDMTGASTRLASRKAMDIFKLIAAVDQDNYPETMGATYVVNAPWVFTAVWRCVKVFLDEGVTAKVHILAEGAPTRDALLAAVDSESLPAFLGGKCRCPGGCVSGVACTAPGGLVVSQQRIVAFCEKYTAARKVGGPLPEELTAEAAAAAAAGKPQAAAAAPAAAPQQPPQPLPLPRVVATRSRVGDSAAPPGGSPRRLERSYAFRKPADEPAMVDPWPAPEEDSAAPELPPQLPPPQLHEPGTPVTPVSDCDDAASAAVAALAASAVAAQAAADAEAARVASLAAQADVAAAVARSQAAEHEARAAAKMAHYAAEEARAAARMAAAAASALAERLSAGTHAAAAAAATVARRASALAPTALRRRRAARADDEEDTFSDALDVLTSDDDDDAMSAAPPVRGRMDTPIGVQY